MKGWPDAFGQDESPDARRQGPPPATLQHLLSELAGRRGWGKRLEGARIHEHWAEIAGPALAEHATPVRLHGGVLVLRAESAAWATQVRYLTAELLRRAADVLGPGQVRKVTVVTGRAEKPGDRPQQ